MYIVFYICRVFLLLEHITIWTSHIFRLNGHTWLMATILERVERTFPLLQTVLRGSAPLCSFHYILGVSGPCGVGSGLGGAPHSELPRGLISLTAGALTGNTCLSGYEKVFPSFFPRLGGFHDTCRPKAPSPRELNQHPDHRRENSSLGVHQTPSPKLITILLPSVCFIGVGG